mmetsp:Transcript_30892/g.95392  ORF Transcript_30892/g.95392 Transcript_30892/m.95392 type:complete len:228 (-) Transcript_30892:54-737(-)
MARVSKDSPRPCTRKFSSGGGYVLSVWIVFVVGTHLLRPLFSRHVRLVMRGCDTGAPLNFASVIDAHITCFAESRVYAVLFFLSPNLAGAVCSLLFCFMVPAGCNPLSVLSCVSHGSLGRTVAAAHASTANLDVARICSYLLRLDTFLLPFSWWEASRRSHAAVVAQKTALPAAKIFETIAHFVSCSLTVQRLRRRMENAVGAAQGEVQEYKLCSIFLRRRGWTAAG